MHARHKHHHKKGHSPDHIDHGHGHHGHAKHRASGGRASHEHGPVNSGSESGQYSVKEPSLVSGNKNVVAAADEKKSIGEVTGIYSPKGHRRARGGRAN